MIFRTFGELYSWHLPRKLITELELRHYAVPAYLNWFWHARRFTPSRQKPSDNGQFLELIVLLGSLAQIVWGAWLLVDWARFGTPGAWEFGAALIISYPVVWAHILALLAFIGWFLYYLAHPKALGKSIVCMVLEAQVKALRRRHKFKLIAVVGSVGKTSTKLAVADLLSERYRVQHQTGNYNDRVTVPLVFFGREEPSLFNVFAWLRVFWSNSKAIRQKYPYDFVVVELGSDAPGQMRQLSYLQPDIAVVTAVSPEHMEFFRTLDAVAAEELAVFDFSGRVLINADDIAGKYLAGREFKSYSLESSQADYYATSKPNGLTGQNLEITTPGGRFPAKVSYVGKPGAKFALAAAAVADMLAVKRSDISQALPKLHHFAGRMQILTGANKSTLIDDTYNASPLAVKAALDVLYATGAEQRIAVLGSMNEMGDYSKEAHQETGAYCDPKKLDLVVTIGSEAKKWLAPAAKECGCSVESFLSPYGAGEFVKSQLKDGAVVLAKGSQNGVFAEEALKTLLANPDDAAKLVRQSKYWQKIKQRQFNG